MIKVLTCIQTEHELPLVALAAAICLFGCWISTTLFDRCLRSRGAGYDWVIVSGLIGGATIWSAHFISMLAFSQQIAASFAPSITVLSLLCAIVSTTIGFAIARYNTRFLLPEMGGAVVGLGGSLMHFIGMRAYEPAGIITYDPDFLRASVVIAGVFGSLAIATVVRRPIRMSQQVGTGLLAVCIIGLHFVAMTAISIAPIGPATMPSPGLSGDALAIGISLVSALVIGVGFFAYSIDRRNSLLAEQDIRFVSHHDLLTGLPNRVAFEEKIGRALDIAAAAHREVVLYVVNIARLNVVNEIIGEQGGDQVIVEVSRRLKSAAGPHGFVARLSGTHFVAMIECHDAFDPQRISEIIRDSLTAAVEIKLQPIRVGFDVGVTVFPRDGADRRELMANADVALERARYLTGNGICFYDQEMDDCIRRKRRLSQDLLSALELCQLELYFQPQCELASMKVVGFEGLLRWRHPDFGFISPAEFIPIAEETGAIVPIGKWVLSTGCRIAASWREPLQIALNLSPVQFRSTDVRHMVMDAVLSCGLPVGRLELEITESTLIENAGRVLEELQGLKDLGVSIALDDFGSGYSSIATLSSFPFDKIKLDKSFLDWARPTASAEAIIGALLTMGQKLGMKILAEGVETEAQLSFLAAERCDQVQGYLIGKPMPATDVDEWVAKFSRRAPQHGLSARLETAG